MQFRRDPEPEPDAPLRPGRRRDPAVDSSVRTAVLELLAERGWDGLSMDAVASRAGVGKASMYRRWSSRVQMVAETIAEADRGQVTVPSTGSLREDLLEVVGAMVASLNGPVGAAARAVVGVLPHEPDLAVAFRAGSAGIWEDAFVQVFTAAVARGEVDPARLGTVAGEAGPAVVMQRWLVLGRPLDDDLVRDVVDRVMLPLLAPR
ncbi:TetR/AcrR family transcriptional regulator [Klenkia brasiliensis]|uniref:Transcriptional regulator, TetR family n=1 Tax=Klenkia brasiliensis TaxID=333142 RepID=A0A1G7WSK5_9ACTN|nr:TetR/AcrR family transcriptional regulator [Klenkia brasiliensis]SDG74955.1 transcriptional regulator, TetR family [Klenkia brasiliensis]